MTRKHFVAIAETLRNNRPESNWDANKRLQWDMDVRAMANLCSRMNAQFDRPKFVAACGGLHNA